MSEKAPAARTPESTKREQNMRSMAPTLLERVGVVVASRMVRGMQFVEVQPADAPPMVVWVKCAWKPGTHGNCAVQMAFPGKEDRAHTGDEVIRIVSEKAERAGLLLGLRLPESNLPELGESNLQAGGFKARPARAESKRRGGDHGPAGPLVVYMAGKRKRTSSLPYAQSRIKREPLTSNGQGFAATSVLACPEARHGFSRYQRWLQAGTSATPVSGLRGHRLVERVGLCRPDGGR